MIRFLQKNPAPAPFDFPSREQNPTLPQKPRLPRTIIAVPISGERIVLRRGGSSSRAALIQDASNAPAQHLLALLDGQHALDDLQATMRRRYPALHPETLNTFLHELHEITNLEDGDAAIPDNLNDQDLLRYSRNLNYFSLSPSRSPNKYALQSRLKTATVLILGVGGLGANCAINLQMLGVSKFVLVDFDRVELQNLNRQTLYGVADIGALKVEAAGQALRRFNPNLELVALNQRLSSAAMIDQIICEHRPRIVLLAADRPFRMIDRWVNAACFKRNTPYITGGVGGNYGLLWSKIPGQTGCHECDRLQISNPEDYEALLYREAHDLIPATSALGCGAQIIAGMLGLEIMRYLLDWPLQTAGKLIEYDFTNMSFNKTDRPAHPDCNVCDDWTRKNPNENANEKL